MKKRMLILLVLLAASWVFQSDAIIGPIRAAKCLFEPDKYRCNDDEKKQAKNWAAVTSATVVATIAAAAGIGAVAKAKKNAGTKEEIHLDYGELTSAMFQAQLSSDPNALCTAHKVYAKFVAKYGQEEVDATLQKRGIPYQTLEKVETNYCRPN